ncbi:MAG: RHS repeat domain-containing protein, partial [Alphaproteobacteria bacterium]
QVPAGVAQVRFKIVSLARTSPQVIWQSLVAVPSDRNAKVRVPAGILKQARTYAWGAESSANTAVNTGPFNVTVDSQHASTQPVHSFAGLGVAAGTGELIYSYAGPQLSTLAGPVSWSLVHRPTTTHKAGVPAGWNLALSGSSGWESLALNADGSVTLASSAGGSVTYTKSGGDQWRPLVGRFHTAGETTLLTQSADGTFSATDGNRTVTVFSVPTVTEAGRPVKVWSLDAPTVQQTWSGGRLTALTDPVTSNQVLFAYGGNNVCPTTVDTGFIPAPNGDLCAIVDWTGSTVMLEYVQTAAGPQIGRIASGIGMGRWAQSEDLAWDASGRIVSLRTAFVATAIASGVVAGLGAGDKRVVTEVAYDAQGRVASLTAPEGMISGGAQPAWLAKRAVQTYTYAPFTVTADGAVVKQVWLDPVSLHTTKLRNESGNVITYTYDAMGNQIRVTDESSGTVTETKYNAMGQPIEQLGPTKGALTGPTVPRTTTAFDQDEQGRDWTGLATRYWANAGFNGAPTSGTTGPIMPGGTAPVAGLSLNWPSNPTGGTGAWAARLTGIYRPAVDGAYVFTNTTAAKLWVNGALCQPECKVTLAKDAAIGLQLDVVSADGAAAGINALVTTPDGKRAPMPTAQLRPNYGLATSTSVRDVAQGVTQELVTKNVFNPVTTQRPAAVAPTGARQTRTAEPYAPPAGQWGRSTSVTDASGKTTLSAYYAQDAIATDCAGQTIQQEGQLATTTFPGGAAVTQVGTPSGGTVSLTSGSTTTCGSISADGSSSVVTTTGLGPTVAVSTNQFVNGNPLEVSTTTTTQGQTATEVSKLDTNGNVWETIDAHGTKTIQHWDPLTDNVTQIIETTAKGETRTTDYTYAANGEVATVVVNGRTLATNEYAPNGTLLKTTLGNGAVQTFELDANNNARLSKTTFPDGSVLSETSTHSPSGRLLSRTVAGPTGTSTFEYSYNKDGRLGDTRLTGTIPTKATAWHNEYTGPDGFNGNRASKTWTNADGTKTTTAFTYGGDNRLLTASEGRIKGDVAYDAAGRATKIGGVSLAYDAAGHLLSAAQGNRTYTFSDQGTKTT